MLEVGRLTGARSGAVEPFADLHLRDAGDERFGAHFAPSLYRTGSRSVGVGYKQFGLADDCAIPGFRPVGVTGIAARSEVFNPIVGAVVIQVIDNDGVPDRCSSSGLPLDRSAAPVAVVRAGADGVVESDSCGSKYAPVGGDRMTWCPDEAMADAGTFGPRMGVVAGEGAEAVGPVSSLFLDRGRAVFADVCHNQQYSDRRH